MLKQCLDKYRVVTNLLSNFSWLPLLLTRLSLGYVFVQAGWGKFHRMPQVIGFFESLGIPLAHIQAPFVASVELLAGVLLILGLFTRVASINLVGVMLVAMLTAHTSDIDSLSKLLQFNLFLFVLLFLYLIFNGAGKISVDNYLKNNKLK